MQLKRLSSNSVYLTFAIPLVAIVGSVVGIAYEGMPWIAAVLMALPVGFWTYFISKSKRVFYQDNSLHLYELFSNKYIVVTKDQLGSIGRWRDFDYNNYRILYYDKNNNDKKIYFLKNFFLSDFDEIIDQLNEID